MENISIIELQAELKNFFKKEYRKDTTYRFCLLFSQLGDLFHYLTHDHDLNPLARSWGSKEDEKGACAQALMQLLMSITVINLSINQVFNKAFGHICKTKNLTIDILEKGINKLTPKVLRHDDIMNLIIKVNRYSTNLENNSLSLNSASVILKTLCIYLTARGFSFKEVLLMGLQNQRERDWAKTVTDQTEKNKLSGIIGVPGVSQGKAYVVNEENPLSNFPTGDILVTEHGKAEHVEEVCRAVGVITDNGGKTCHMVNILLPKNIPCLVGTGSATKKIKHGQMVTIYALDENGSNQGPGYVQF